MGQDIHVFVEARVQDRLVEEYGQRWLSVTAPASIRPKVWPYELWYPYQKPDGVWLRDRDYDLFGVLFGEGGRRPHVCEGQHLLRGAPDDIAQLAEEEIEEYGMDAHSLTWYTFAELKVIEWPASTPPPYDVFGRFKQWVDAVMYLVGDDGRMICFLDN